MEESMLMRLERHSLQLPTRQANPAVTDDRIQTTKLRANEIRKLRLLYPRTNSYTAHRHRNCEKQLTI
jgi:ribosomal protein L17